jgi:aldose 1-epimerase
MSRYRVETVQKEGYSVIVMQDTGSESVAEVLPAFGNNIYRFESGGRQVLMPPASLVSLTHDTYNQFRYGIPILFPPNRVNKGVFSFSGREYRLPVNEPPDYHLHGEICSKAWEVVETAASEEQGAYVTSRFRYASHPEILSYFPHPITFTLTCRLREGRLHLDGAIANEGEDEAPFAFGLHPYFSVPFDSGEEMTLKVPAAQEWPVTDLSFVTGPPALTGFTRSLNEGFDLSAIPELGCSLVSLGAAEGEHTCRIEMKRSNYTIAYRFDQMFKFLLLFRPDWARSFSLEPYTCVTDAFNLPYGHDMTGVRGIQAGEVIPFTTSMWAE